MNVYSIKKGVVVSNTHFLTVWPRLFDSANSVVLANKRIPSIRFTIITLDSLSTGYRRRVASIELLSRTSMATELVRILKRETVMTVQVSMKLQHRKDLSGMQTAM